MNETQAKALFMAQYLGQFVIATGLLRIQNPTPNNNWVLTFDILDNTKIWYLSFGKNKFTLQNRALQLRTIDQLTDEEIIRCGKIGFGFFECSGFELKIVKEINKISLAAVAENGKVCLVKIEINNPYKLNIHQIDYLRRIGILLPFTYINDQNEVITLQAADIIAKGWAVVNKK